MRISRGLPFNACVHARVCTGLNSIFQSHSQSLSFSPYLTNNHLKLYQGVAPPGRTYLTYRWRAKQGEEKNEAQAENIAMHLCVCLITLILPLIICNLSNLSLYRVLSCDQGGDDDTRRALCVMQAE